MPRLKSQNFSRLLLAASISLLLFSLAGLVWLNLRLNGKSFWRGTTPLPILAQLPDFRLVTSTGQTLALDDLKGKVWIANFIFTRCPGPCPRMSVRMASLQRDLNREGSLSLVSFSVDPEFDTPKVLAKYAAQFQAEEGRWFFLTGDKADIHRLAKSGFLVGGVDDVTLHTTRFVLVDRQGRVRGYYSSSDEEDLRKLANDARALLRESPA
ncbi:MAG: SCO family protein [Acidobacteria bacterium]|nr:SCO family protein [Acidobacteriota bacterium]MCI0621915.1 SCO family protein [Acidobacteriota bacterium]MCI0720217.1 SCO family protein [Acidobacteriota bacterium]